MHWRLCSSGIFIDGFILTAPVNGYWGGFLLELIMTFEELKEKAHALPLAPGVYIMRNKSGQVIYVGKAKKLKNRVSQYFLDTVSHTQKTRTMVSKIHDFDVIIAASEFEALVLECSLIKRHMPKYNILLKDDKGYPYIRLDMQREYPTLSMVGKTSDDGALYFGPFGSRGITQNLLQTLLVTLKLPSCKKNFPKDIGKERPCLNYHMNQCAGWCQRDCTSQQYMDAIEQAKQLLSGNYKKVAAMIREQMLSAAENLEFELAAGLRDKLNAVETLGQKQLVTAGALADVDVIGFAQTEAKACFAVLHFAGGNLLDKDYEVLPYQDDPQNAVSSLVKQYYLSRGSAPKVIFMPFEIDDSDLFEQLLLQQYEKRIRLKVPQRGDNVKLVDLANKNALEEAQRVTTKEEKNTATLSMLGKMLSVPSLLRIESYDISNISGTDMVASMVVFENGKPLRSAYRRFKIEELEDQNDFAAMEQVVCRRFAHYLAGDKGFEVLPDLVLIDGGAVHANIAAQALARMQIHTKVMGMVKDDRHRTRALMTPQGQEIAIDIQPSVFALIGSIQEETHRFAITFHRQLRSKRLRYSELDGITGIGPKRKQELLKQFKSLAAIREAQLPELERILPIDAAVAVYNHFHKEESI